MIDDREISCKTKTKKRTKKVDIISMLEKKNTQQNKMDSWRCGRSYNRQVVRNDLRKFFGDIVIHMEVLFPWFLSGIEVESGAFEKKKNKQLVLKVDCGTKHPL